MCKSSTKLTKSLIRLRAIQFWDPIAFLPFGVVLAVSAKAGGKGDPVMLYDHLANRWLISQFAGSGSAVTDECVAISTTSDATGSYNRYGFHLGTNFFDYPHLSVWPDAYYMSMNVFNASGNYLSWSSAVRL